jgi:hypothetical protein
LELLFMTQGRENASRLLGAFATLVLVGCQETGVNPYEGTAPVLSVVVTDTFAQSPVPAVDLLFVIDSTASMASETAALSASIDALVTGLEGAQISWQAGVVTMDMQSADAGWLLGAPYVVTPQNSSDLAELLEVPLVGTGDEAGFAAAALALDLVESGENVGFLRDNAVLHVVFVSDTDDHSEDFFVNEPASDFLEILLEYGQRAGGDSRASAIVGDVPDGCITDDGAALAGTQYDVVVQATGGTTVSICEADYAALLESVADATLVYEREFSLSGEPLSGETMGVSVDGERVLDGWTLAYGPPMLVFDVAPHPSAVITAEYVMSTEL